MRKEFTARTKRLADDRAGHRCEGTRFGKRCSAHAGRFHYDHRLPCWNGGDNSLGNCQLLCTPCHKRKSAAEEAEQAHHDRLTGRINAKSGKPVRAQCQGTHAGKGRLRSRGFAKPVVKRVWPSRKWR